MSRPRALISFGAIAMTADGRGHLQGTPYDFVRELGRGGMGIVVEAVDRRSNDVCAVKLIHREGGAAAELVDRLRLEAETLEKARSAHFVGFRGSGVAPDGSPYYVMERLVGRTLKAEIVKRSALPLQEVLVIAIQLFDGLADAHALGVVHRDVKPENVFLCDGSEPRLVRVLDFGIAKVVEPRAGGPAPLAVPTAIGLMVGSLRWAAPEIVTGEAVDHRTDLYSGGLLLFAMASGQSPWSHATSAETLATAQLRESLPRIEELLRNDDYRVLDTIIAGTTAKSRTARTKTARDVASELRHHLRERYGTDLPAVRRGEPPRLVPASNERAAGGAPSGGPKTDVIPIPSEPHRGVSFPRLSPGYRFEQRYEIVGHLGQGGMGTVYRAKHTFLGREIALKLIPLEAKAINVDLRKQFALEMEVLARLDHPNIVKIYDGGVTSDGVAYIVMELLPGDSLRKSLQAERALEDGAACSYLRQVADGLVALHAVPILHRDIKPENIIVEPNGSLKIVDFGLARVRTKSKYATQNPNSVGTLHYMPKEQLMNEPLDESVDVYAFGLVMFECFTGVHPRSTSSGAFQNKAEAIASVIEGRPIEPIENRRPDLPPGVVDLWRRCVDADPQKRPKAAEVARAFASFAQWELAKTDTSSPPAMSVGSVGGPTTEVSVLPPMSGPTTSRVTIESAPPARLAATVRDDGPMPIPASLLHAHRGATTAPGFSGEGIVGKPSSSLARTQLEMPSPVRAKPRSRTRTVPILLSVVFVGLTVAVLHEVLRPGTLLPGVAAKPTARPTTSVASSPGQSNTSAPIAALSAPSPSPSASPNPTPASNATAAPVGQPFIPPPPNPQGALPTPEKPRVDPGSFR